jgi:DNA-binding beta-propeller fold protein YncE
MKRWILLAGGLAVFGLVLAGCKSSTSPSPTETITISPTTASVPVGTGQVFIATVSGPTDQTVTWQVNNIVGGNSTIGTISTAGVYTAPTTIPVPNKVTVTAVSHADSTFTASATVLIDSGIRVTVTPSPVIIGTGEALNFTATVTGTFNTAVTWVVCQATNSSTVSGAPCTADTTNTLGTIDVNGNYHAPVTVPSANPVSIEAISVADVSQFGSATITLVAATDPVAISVYPTHAAQGSLFVDVYLKGSNFVSTTLALVNGVTITGPTSLRFGSILRVRIPDTLLSPAPTVLQVQVKRQGGTPVDCAPDVTQCRITLDATRPAIVTAAPNSGLQNGPPVEFSINGGYFGTNSNATTPTVTAEFDGTVRGAGVSARQLQVTLSGADLSVPGLHQVTVVNSAVTTPAILPAQTASTNFAVQSCLGVSGCPGPTVTVPSLGVGTAPVAIGINTATGIAVVVNHGSNNVTLVDLSGVTPTLVPGGTIAVGTGPTGVAIDNVRNLAVVTNNTAKTISVINLATKAVTTVNTQITAAPFSVGVNPITGIALIAYQSTNIGALVDLTQSPPVFVGAVTLGTGVGPQVAVVPGLNWGLVTPGGAGTFSIVDLARRNQNSISANGAVRVSATSTVTITTTSPHGLITGDAVLITGVTDASFNGVFSVVSVPSTTSFTLTQSGADATSGSGVAFYSRPVATVGFGVNVTGIAMNAEAGRAILTDPTPTNASVLTMSVLDQAVTPLLLEPGSGAVAVNPYTDVAVAVNPTTHQGSVIDPRTPLRMTTFNLTGTNPSAIAIDPGSNQVLIANQGSNDLTVVSLDTAGHPIKPIHLESVILPLNRQFGTDLTLASSTDLPLTLIGKGFVGKVARIDGFVLPAVGPVTDRVMNVSVPGTLLGSARRFSMDIVDPAVPSSVSNSEGFSVVKAIDLTSLACPAPSPAAVAFDDLRNLALVTLATCKSVAIVDVNSATVTNNITVGNNPQGVATVPRLGLAVATNRGDNTASIINLADLTQAAVSISVGIEPIGVDISPVDGTTLVTNSNVNSNSVTEFGAGEGPSAVTTLVGVCGAPVAVAINPYDQQALVACAASTGGSNIFLLNISSAPPSAISQATGPNQPTGVAFDPVTKLYVVTSSLGNSVFFINPANNQITSARDGINPFSIAFNYLTNTIVTVNALSNTVSVMDFGTRRVISNMGLKGALLGAVAILPRSNLVLIVDQVNNRLLMVPLQH